MTTCWVIVEAPCAGASLEKFDSSAREQAADVDAVVEVELACPRRRGRPSITCWRDLGERDRLAVLQLEDGDHVAVRRRTRSERCGERLELRQLRPAAASWALATRHSRGATPITTAVDRAGAPATTMHTRRRSQASRARSESRDSWPERRCHGAPTDRAGSGGLPATVYCRARRSAPSVPLRRPGIRRRRPPPPGVELARRAEPPGYAALDDARPLHRPAGAGAGARHGRRSGHDRRCGSGRWCGTTTTSTRSCWPRSWRRWTCCPSGRLEIGLGAGWMRTDYEQAGIALRPARGAHRPLRGGARRDQGRCSGETVLRSPASTTGSPATTASPSRCSSRARRSSSAAAASGCCRIAARRGRHRRDQRHAARGRRRAGRGPVDDGRGGRREGRLVAPRPAIASPRSS